MEDYIGKICPFCKSEIKAGEEVKVCPDCGIPHHLSCWNKNQGCTTFGCAQQHYDAPNNEEKAEICLKCGAHLEPDQAFCPKCGTPRKKEPEKLVCSNCGTELQEGQAFCHKCGQKAGFDVNSGVASAIRQFNSKIEQQNLQKKKAPVKIAIAVVIVIFAALAFKTIAPKIFIDYEGYMAQGNYEKAYQKASDDEKLEVMAENATAVESAYSVDNLKDPSSFVLRDAYFYKTTNSNGETIYQLVLYISGANSYGASVSSYWLYTWDTDDEAFSYYTSVSSLSNEEYNSWDDTDDMIEKLVNNVGRSIIKTVMSDGIKLGNDAVDRINTFFDEDTLDDVELLDAFTEDD